MVGKWLLVVLNSGRTLSRYSNTRFEGSLGIVPASSVEIVRELMPVISSFLGRAVLSLSQFFSPDHHLATDTLLKISVCSSDLAEFLGTPVRLVSRCPSSPG